MSERFRAIPAQARCKRCAELFVYFRFSRPRRVCDPCLPLLKAEENRANNAWMREMGIVHRKNAREAHGA